MVRVTTERRVHYTESATCLKLVDRFRPVAVQALSDDGIAMFELFVQGDEISVADERHYQLVPGKEICAEDLVRMSRDDD